MSEVTDLTSRVAQLSPAQRAALLSRVQAARGVPTPPPPIVATRRGVGETVTLSFAQERIWFLEQFAPGTPYHNMSGVARIPVGVDVAAFTECLEEMVARHEVLRTCFGMRDGAPVGIITSAGPIPVRVLGQLPDDEREQQFADDARQPFDLSAAPLLRVGIAADGPDHTFVQLTMHHLVSDGYSTAIFFAELGALYRPRAAGRRIGLPPLEFQFADVTAAERDRHSGGHDAAALRYWTEQLDGAPHRLALPSDLPRPASMTRRGGRLPVSIPAAVVDRIQAVSREQQVTVFVTMLTAFAVVLGRYAGQDDLVVGVPVANREQPGTERLIGPFLNTLALRFRLTDEPSFDTLMHQVHRTVLGGFEHQSVPFEQVLQAVRAPRDPSRSPLFQVVFNVQTDRSTQAGPPGTELRDLPNGGCQFDLLVNLVTSEAGISGHVDYYADAYQPGTIARIIDSFVSVLATATDNGGRHRPVTELPLRGTPPADRRTQLRPRSGTVVDLVLDAVQRGPDRIALVDEHRSLTYRDLDEASARLAGQLAGLPTGPGGRVGLCLPRSVDMILAILATLRAGLTYVPLDPAYPPDRLALICRDAELSAVVTRGDGTEAVLPALEVPTIRTDRPLPEPSAEPGSRRPVTADSCAYIIYTSGSTGRPKGVRVTHRNVVNFLESMRHRPGLAASDVLLAVTSPSFDIAVLEMLLPLTLGARTVVADPADVVDGQRLAGLLTQHSVSVLQATPTTWQLLLDSPWPGDERLRALCGGEALPTALAARMLEQCGQVWNMYGPTETTIWSLVHRVTSDDVAAGTIPIGQPIDNTTAQVVDRGGNPVPVGVLGELLIGGDGVAAGYHRQPELTAARFIDSADGRRYRTGDLVRTRANGDLEFAGRLDDQVKLRGFRIELGEIEAVLESHPGVARAVAVLRHEAIAAYLEPLGGHPGTADALTDELRALLQRRLPDYMVPAHLVRVDQWPLTPNGKLDRGRLPDVAGSDDGPADDADSSSTAPRTDTERSLVAIWQDLLGVPHVGVRDGFFELGGHSMLATKLTFRVREECGVDLPLQTLFEGDPTIARLAAIVDSNGTDEASTGQDGPELDLAAEAQLDVAIAPTPGAHVHSVRYPQHPLVTGATGFLGAFLLADLLRSTDATFFCLVRAASAADGHRRIRDNLAEYDLWDDEYADRIIPVLGRLDRRRLGLGRPQWQHLAAMIDVIYHSGAEVNFLASYQALKPTNVLGTVEILRLACDGSVKPVHFVSTTYVFSRFSYPPGTELTEEMDPVHDLRYTFGYTQSKWVSERLVRQAGDRGVPVYIYRPGRVAGHSRTGACHTYDLVWQATKVGIEMGAAPLMDMTLDITPVDYVVAAMAHLSRQPQLHGQIFHLVSRQPIDEPELVNWLEQRGYVAERLSFADWCQRVEQRAAELSDRTAGALAPFLSGTLPLDRMPEARFDHRNVTRGLADTTISCPDIDDGLLSRYFDYFTSTGYLPTPAGQSTEPGHAHTSIREDTR